MLCFSGFELNSRWVPLTGVWVFAMRINVSTIVPYFRIICYWNVEAYVLWKGQLDIWPFEERCQLSYCQEPFWLLFICVCLPIVLIQSNFNTPGDTSRLDANRFSHSVQPIFRDIFFFLFTRNNYTSGNRNIFAVSLLKLVSKRLFPFTVNWSDYILALKLQMCYVNYALCPSPFAIHSNTNHKTNSECSGSGL